MWNKVQPLHPFSPRGLAPGRCRSLPTLACSLFSREGYQRENIREDIPKKATQEFQRIRHPIGQSPESRFGSPRLSQGLSRRLWPRLSQPFVTKVVASIVVKVIAKGIILLRCLQSSSFFDLCLIVRGDRCLIVRGDRLSCGDRGDCGLFYRRSLRDLRRRPFRRCSFVVFFGDELEGILLPLILRGAAPFRSSESSSSMLPP